MLPKVGDRLRLRSGELCEVAMRSATPLGATVWVLRCLSGHWRGVLTLSTRELGYNVA